MCRLIPETAGSLVRLATSAQTARTRTGRPRRRGPSQCVRWSAAPTGCEPILKNAPPRRTGPRRCRSEGGSCETHLEPVTHPLARSADVTREPPAVLLGEARERRVAKGEVGLLPRRVPREVEIG